MPDKLMPDGWVPKEFRNQYKPSTDGAFERWMDEHEPYWKLCDLREIEFYRELWDAAKASSGLSVD